MEQITITTQEITTTVHDFTCDGCGVALGSSTEDLNGAYDEIGLFELNFLVDNVWYHLEKHLCDTCKEEFLTSVRDTLTGLGFEVAAE